jgi:hypothetical protein
VAERSDAIIIGDASLSMSVDDNLSEWFECTEVKAVLAYCSGVGAFATAKSPARLTSAPLLIRTAARPRTPPAKF